MDELVGFEAALEQHPQVSDDFLELARGILDKLPLEQMLQYLTQLGELLVNLVEYFRDPKFRWAVRRADDHPNLPVGWLVHYKVRWKLPEQLQTTDITKAVIQAARVVVDRLYPV